MRLHQLLLLAHHLLYIRADRHQGLFQIQSEQVPALSFEDWSSVVNAHPVGLTPPTPSDQSIKPAPAETNEPTSSEFATVIPMIDDQIFGSRPLPIFGALQGLVKSLVSFAFSPLSGLPHLPWPHRHETSPIDLSQFTIWEVLNWTLHHPPKFGEHDEHHQVPIYRLAWLVNQSEPIQRILSDPDADLTFFAPDDKALTPPKKHHHGDRPDHGHGHHHEHGLEPLTHPDDHIFWQLLEANLGCHHGHTNAPLVNEHDDDDDDKKQKKKKILLHLLQAVLKYHISPGAKCFKDILDSSTLPSALHIAHEPSSPVFRIRVGGPPHFTKPGATALNFFTELDDRRPILTKNGIIYVVRGVPLLPPFSPLSELFLYPKTFSTLTSALQKVKLDEVLLPSWDGKTIPLEEASTSALDLDSVDGRVQDLLSEMVTELESRLKKRSFTVFAPTNRAFLDLGPHANAFLFSPFGTHILRYILSYHIVPDIIWYTDHVDKTKEQSTITKADLDSDFLSQLMEDEGPSLFRSRGFPRHPPGHPHVPLHPPKLPWDKANVTEITLPTLLGSAKNVSLSICLVEFNLPGHLPGSKVPRRQVFVKQPVPPPKDLSMGESEKPLKPIPVVLADGAVWGGAVHMIPTVIHPPIPPTHPHYRAFQRVFPEMREEEQSLFV